MPASWPMAVNNVLVLVPLELIYYHITAIFNTQLPIYTYLLCMLNSELQDHNIHVETVSMTSVSQQPKYNSTCINADIFKVTEFTVADDAIVSLE
ncbi:hypothetical protein TWF225_001956 [Orbilia oligospora]|uniref:Uncharacterized protein n=1 Tax=Orbilia oligospora TaxID=2813651 RepID=A0A7C8PH83_ORBOL|nr:hypothetical protein TWF751_002009 [Orbilia oligospora]KAF3164077.1 hypothetical protein TWF225_001956 [Orbilia oligospora]KAF3237436.1 hypothetical protein TWF128_000898 [Orbilia oligospora]KAF3247456.1 hypothetical protein TWF217_009613 [Orbilia oligospora]KAF3283431.1 hypothetical protein TWF132_010374 [Orbilia oligospora]